MRFARNSLVFPCLLISTATFAQPADLPLLHEEDLLYEGAFRVPAGGDDSETFRYGGYALAYNAERDSLFLTGHGQHQRSAEIGIPKTVDSSRLDDLETAPLLQAFADATEGRRREINPGDPNTQKIGGHLVYENMLYVSAYSSYDGAGTQRSTHFVRPLSLSSKGAVRGPYRVGSRPHFTSAYMSLVPGEWRQSLGGPALTGNCCRSIISNHSHGPALFVFDPAELDRRGGRVKATPLVYYTSRRPLGPGESSKNPYFNLTTRIEGVVFPKRTRTILFFGSHGIGEYCYGEAAECNDPAMPYKGTHAYPYVYQVWAYDVEELVGVGKGKSAPHRVQPYALWTFNLPFEDDGGHTIGGAAYDMQSDKIFLSQVGRDEDRRPLIHVFRVKRGPRPVAP